MPSDSVSRSGTPSSWLEFALALLLSLIMGLTFVDVVGRYVFNAPLPAAYEITELSMGLLVFGGLVSVTSQDTHLRVDLLDRFFSVRVDAARQIVIGAVSGLVLAAFAWQLAMRGLRAATDQAQTQLLGVSTAPFLGVMALLTALAALSQFSLTARKASSVIRGRPRA